MRSIILVYCLTVFCIDNHMIKIPFRGDIDLKSMLSLVRENPEPCVHVVDLPYRLSSWVMENPGNVALWEDKHGQLMAWAVLQTPFWILDFALHPSAPTDALATVLLWADGAAADLSATMYGRPEWYVAAKADSIEVDKGLQAAGYTSQKMVEHPWTQVTMALPENALLPECPVKPGYQIRPLRGEEEIAAYVALHRAVFGTENMTESWRRQTLRQPDYRPELDLVIEDADGALAAFCISWVAQVPRYLSGGVSGLCGQIEPFGVREDSRRAGLAWSLIAETVRRMRAAGVEKIIVQTDNYRDRAYNFYQAAGFRVIEDITIYRKSFA